MFQPSYFWQAVILICIFTVIKSAYFTESFQNMPHHRGVGHKRYNYQNYFSNKSPIFKTQNLLDKSFDTHTINSEINIYDGYTNHNYNQVDYIPWWKKNVLQTIPTIDHFSCQYICDSMPECDSVNYALNICTLYKQLRNPLIHDKYLYC